MKPQVHNLKQGTSEWREFRLNHFGASEAPAMLGLTKKITRNELLHIKNTGNSKEYGDWVENVLFKNGHEAEAAARLILEIEIGEDLYPVTYSKGTLSASCDGLTLDGKIAFEHKLININLAALALGGVVPDDHMAQCQQILMVTGADKLFFVVSDGTEDNYFKVPVYPDQSWFKKIADGWKQFEKDLKEYQPKESIEKPQADTIMQLPALSIQIKGEVIASNLPKFKADAEQFVQNINTNLTTDNDFATAEATVKFCKETESKLDQAKESALAQTSSIDEVMRTIDYIKEELRKKRLDLDKKVKTEKERIKQDIIKSARQSYSTHIDELEREINPIKLECELPDFAGQLKNKRTLESLQNAADTELANAKINASAVAKHVRENLAWYHAHVDGNEMLFCDLQSIVYKDFDDFKLLVNNRLDEQKKIIEEERLKAKADEERRIEEQKRMAEIDAIKAEESAKVSSVPTTDDLNANVHIKKSPVSEHNADYKVHKPSDDGIKPRTAFQVSYKTSTIQSLIEGGVAPAEANKCAQLIYDGRVKHVSVTF